MAKENNNVSGDILTRLFLAQGYSEEKARHLNDKVIFCGTLGNLLMDVADSFFKDEMALLQPLGIKLKQEKRFHYNEAVKASKGLTHHLNHFTSSVYRDNLGIDAEDYSYDLYEIVKLIADHTKTRGDMQQIKNAIAKRKCNWHIFDD